MAQRNRDIPVTSGRSRAPLTITHPNAVYVDQGFSFQLLVDGAPAAGVPISVYRSGNVYDDRRIAALAEAGAFGTKGNTG